MVDIIGTVLVAFANCRAATSPSAVGNVGSAIEVLFLTLARVEVMPGLQLSENASSVPLPFAAAARSGGKPSIRAALSIGLGRKNVYRETGNNGHPFAKSKYIR